MFVSGGGDYGGTALSVVNPGGGRASVVITRNKLIDYYLAPSWSADGRSVTFAAFSGPIQEDVYIARADGTQLRDLGGSGYDDPSWSPDGKRIVFDALAGPTPSGCQMEVVDLSNRKVTPLGRNHSNSDTLCDRYPVWSPDGRWICFARSVGASRAHLYLEHPDGSGLHQLGRTPGTRPDWSPDGQTIAFDNGRDLFTLNKDGRDLRRIDQSATFASWSPDAEFIAFQRVAGSRPLPDLWVMLADGSNPMRLARNARAPDWQAQ
jgi:Tol biopolymer transport system component